MKKSFSKINFYIGCSDSRKTNQVKQDIEEFLNQTNHRIFIVYPNINKSTEYDYLKNNERVFISDDIMHLFKDSYEYRLIIFEDVKPCEISKISYYIDRLPSSCDFIIASHKRPWFS